MLKLDVISPVFNEESGIEKFLDSLTSSLNQLGGEIDAQIILVSDGSTDNTLNKIKNYKSSIEIKIIELSRNFGHQAAVWCGLSESRDDAYSIVMDADLQDPPELVEEILREVNSGQDVILMMRRSRDDSIWKRLFASLFYGLQANLTDGKSRKNVGDFFCVSPRARQTLLEYRESVKFVRGLVGEIGYDPLILQFDRQKRNSGKTHYSIKQMFTLALSSITGFTIKPLILVVNGALFGSFLSIVTICYVLYLKLFTETKLQPGWSFLAITQLALSSLILLSLGILALYLARAIQELKSRPIFTVKDRTIIRKSVKNEEY
jgi:glycosyltransferase involved in cell wall biosynthesis